MRTAVHGGASFFIGPEDWTHVKPLTVDDGLHMVGQAVEQLSGQCRFRLLAHDRYAWVVAEVSASEAVLNEELVRLGHTWMYRSYVSSHRRRRYSALEDEARGTRSGLWGANAAPVRRREWRKGQRSKLLAWLWNCLRNLFRGTD